MWMLREGNSKREPRRNPRNKNKTWNLKMAVIGFECRLWNLEERISEFIGQ